MYRKNCLELIKDSAKLMRAKLIKAVVEDEDVYSCQITFSFQAELSINKIRQLIESNLKQFKDFYYTLYTKEYGNTLNGIAVSTALDPAKKLQSRVSNGWQGFDSVDMFDRALLIIYDKPVEYDPMLYISIEVAGVSISKESSSAGYITVNIFQPEV